jgi:hypothetical protein
MVTRLFAGSLGFVLLAEVLRQHGGAAGRGAGDGRQRGGGSEAGLALLLDDARVGGRRLMPFSCAVWWIGLVKPTPFSVQPMQGWPQATGQFDSPTSPKPMVEQLA